MGAGAAFFRLNLIAACASFCLRSRFSLSSSAWLLFFMLGSLPNRVAMGAFLKVVAVKNQCIVVCGAVCPFTENSRKISNYHFLQRATAHPLQRTMKSRTSSGGLVYSTDSGRMCPDCRQPMASCRCSAAPVRAPSDGVVRVSRETKGRAGKGVTLVKGVPLDAVALVALGKQLKAACGSGGTVKDGVIEVQGDHCDQVMQALGKQGFTAKRAGG